jgi:phosphoribosylformylglycinamidine cyclo-ligase
MTEAYRSAGVDYDVLDAAKRRSIDAVLSTLPLAGGSGAKVVEETIGEPAQVVEIGGLRLATVLECLGTKSSICRDVEDLLGIDCWHSVGIDCVAAVVNDLCCTGAVPVTVSAYVATGHASWYSGSRHASLVAGWADACERIGAAWVGGESPTLSGIVEERSADLAGSALGVVPPGSDVWLASRIEPGDEIVLVASSGLHANGASLARSVARVLDRGWATPLPSGDSSLGAAVLAPSVLYPPLVRALIGAGAPVHYASHVTGHGLRKLMRADRELTYRIRELPPVPEVLQFVVTGAGLDEAAAYGTFNMGVGFALYVEAGAGARVGRLAEEAGFPALVGGTVEAGARRVVLEPVGVVYASEELELR